MGQSSKHGFSFILNYALPESCENMVSVHVKLFVVFIIYILIVTHLFSLQLARANGYTAFALWIEDAGHNLGTMPAET